MRTALEPINSHTQAIHVPGLALLEVVRVAVSDLLLPVIPAQILVPRFTA